MIDQRDIYMNMLASARIFLYTFKTQPFSVRSERKNCLSCAQMRFISSYSSVQSSPILEFIAFQDRAGGWSSV